ncbi:MAG: hypothetical protein ACOYMV_12375 [Verrucomicrobiia bacterium]
MGTALAGIVTGEYRIARVEKRIVRGMRVMLDPIWLVSTGSPRRR